MFKNSRYKSLDDYQGEVQNDLLKMVNTVHDEVQYIAELSHLKPLFAKLNEIGSLKDGLIDKLPPNYVNVLFDVEYCKKTGNMLVKDSFNPDEYIMTLEELGLYKEYQELLQDFTPVVGTKIKDTKVKEVSVIREKLYQNPSKEFVDKLVDLPDGDYTVFVEVEGVSLKYKRKVDLSFLDVK